MTESSSPMIAVKMPLDAVIVTPSELSPNVTPSREVVIVIVPLYKVGVLLEVLTTKFSPV